MASVTGITAERAEQIWNESVVSGQVDSQGQLLLKTRGGATINAGPIVAPAIATDRAWPVGSIYISNSSENPSETLGIGTWVRYANGRVLVGQDPNDTDFNTFSKTGGAKNVTLTAAQSGVPAHAHSFSGTTAGEDVIGFSSIGADGAANETKAVIRRGQVSGGSQKPIANSTHSHTFSGATANNGAANASQAHTNMPPYAVVYFWIRTA